MRPDILYILLEHLSADDTFAYIRARDAVLAIDDHTHTPALDTIYDFAPDGCSEDTWQDCKGLSSSSAPCSAAASGFSSVCGGEERTDNESA